uniref:Uncharacterized protein n=1 Tax=viral metagenome TaxID=1070528 RepID=A0A6M3LNF5_9ZZZZ
MNLSDEDKANPVLYRLYWRYCLTDILQKLGFEATRTHKEYLHEFHKRVLNYKSTKGMTHEKMGLFIAEVCLFWAEHGIFIRTKKNQPIKIQELPLSVCWKWL